MQTFLPYADFEATAKILDGKRLGKQRVECLQIYRSLTEPLYGWKFHPAVLMWKNHTKALLVYFRNVMKEWSNRGYQSGENLNKLYTSSLSINEVDLPIWFGDPRFHLSHQSNLVRKDPAHYRTFFPDIPDNIPYFWPTKHEKEKP